MVDSKELDGADDTAVPGLVVDCRAVGDGRVGWPETDWAEVDSWLEEVGLPAADVDDNTVEDDGEGCTDDACPDWLAVDDGIVG